MRKTTTKHFNKLLLASGILAWNACQNPPAPPPPPVAETASAPVAPKPAEAPWIIASEKKEVMVFGRPVKFDDMKKTLQDSLVKMAVIPENIPIKFEGEILMGMRGEIETQAKEAITFAKEARQKPGTRKKQ